MFLLTPHSARRTPHFALRTAFTLVELISVMLILGIMTAAAVPSFSDSLMYHRVESATLRLKKDLELARQLAISRSTSHTLQFTSTTAYTIPGVDSLDRVGQPYTVDLAQPPHSVRVLSVDFSGSATVSFNGYGMPSSAGTIVIQAGKHQRQIALDGQGLVRTSKL
jgi:prepilin-type N-terminal cleavage/methylation domain-containing protein